ncbi:coiled-coil domain-containing protein 115-like [Sitophilus oryzae]|uniref:Vacuolar ATPase assembly protein VMA22 n=1 Tax=Sitophilus oryzae TaxID=7048 RepID=A0A6J2YN01_SITOR|nr:coiled-coil domain-containing protein 115-like [Sitophilus oryzae]
MVEDTEDLDKICNTLDKLTLDSLTLMQEQIELKLNAENAMIGGETHLAKTRYILGQNSVSSLQLPTDSSTEFSALTTVNTSKDEHGINQFDLESNKPDNEKYINPIKWFGYLTPQNLTFAQNLYRQALQWIIQAANVQTRLQEVCTEIHHLKKIKNEIMNK